MKTTTLLFTSEHGGNKIPEDYKSLFKDSRQLLKTHRGYDLGIWSLAERLSQDLQAKLFTTEFSRLLVDVNRSLWRRTLFSEITKPLPKSEKEIILNTYYYPHRKMVTSFIDEQVKTGQKILHIATHSFTPVMDGIERNADVGFLYNPERSNEKLICRQWKKCLIEEWNDVRIRFNYPYRGKPDGLTAHFRKIYPNDNYLGVELEINQKYVQKNGCFPENISIHIVEAFQKTIRQFSWL